MSPSHTYVGNPGYVFRLEAHGVVTLNPGDPVSLTAAEAEVYAADFATADKPKSTPKSKETDR